MALGVQRAVDAAGKNEAKVIGLDGIVDALKSVEAGELAATVAQYPYVVGAMGLEACVAAIRRDAADPGRRTCPPRQQGQCRGVLEELPAAGRRVSRSVPGPAEVVTTPDPAARMTCDARDPSWWPSTLPPSGRTGHRRSGCSGSS